MAERLVLIVRMVESIERNGVYRPSCGILQERDADLIIGIYPDGSMKVYKDCRAGLTYCGTKVKLQLDRQGSEAPRLARLHEMVNRKCPDCDGSGCQQRTIDLLLCHRCKGTGRIPVR